MKSRMSFLLILPPRPVPFTRLKSTCFSRAMRRTKGEVRTSSASSPSGGGQAPRGARSPREPQGKWWRAGRGVPRRRSRSFGRRRRRHARAFAVDHRHHRVHPYRLILLGQNLGQHTRRGRGNLRVDLVRGNLEQRFVAVHPFTYLLHPFSDGSLGNTLPHLGHDHVGGHG